MSRYALIVENDIEKARQLAEAIDDKQQVEYVYLYAELLLAEDKGHEADAYLDSQAEFYGDEGEYALDVASLFMDYEKIRYSEKWLQRCTLTDDNEYKELQARIMLRRGQFDECERIFNELIDSDPYSSNYWNQLASSQLLQNHLEDAITSSEFSLAINPNDDEALLNKANALFTLGNHQEALVYYERFAEQQPHNESAQMMIGITLSHLERQTEAVPYLEKALVLAKEHDNDINYEQTLQELTYIEDQLGHTDVALHYIDEMEAHLKERQQSKATIAKMALVPRGYVLLEHQRYDEAVQQLQQAFFDAKGNTEVIYYICIAIYDTGYYRFAYRLFRLLFMLVDDEWSDGYAYYARCCLLVGDIEEYYRAVKKAAACNPEEARFALEGLYPEGTEPQEYPNIPLNISRTNNDNRQ